jgi:hypothetical protein
VAQQSALVAEGLVLPLAREVEGEEVVVEDPFLNKFSASTI